MEGIVVLPSLDRPQELVGFFKAYKETESIVPGLVLIDRHDFFDRKLDYEAIELPRGWEYRITGDNRAMGDKIRSVFEEVSKMDWVMILNDDHRPRTKNWDQKIIAHVTGYNIIGTNDGAEPSKPWNAGRRLCGAITFSGPILRELGYMFPDGLQHMFSDDVWGMLCGRSGCGQVLMDICVEHEHAFMHKDKRDKTFELINGAKGMAEIESQGFANEGMWPNDRVAFEKWAKEKYEQDAKKLVKLQPKTGIMIATPFHNAASVAVDYMMGIMDTSLALAQQNIHFEFARIENSSLIPHARNSLVDLFLNSKCQRMLFIDSDEGFNRNHIFTLLNSARPIVAGVVPHKRFPLNLNFEPLEEDMKYFKEPCNKTSEEFFHFVKEKADVKGEIAVNRVGSGFMMVDRSVFQMMNDDVDKYYPFDDRKVDKHAEYFKMGAVDGHYRGEDWLFCLIAKRLEIPVYINTNVLISHVGTHKFMIDESKRIA